MKTTLDTTLRNGIDTAALQSAIDQMTVDPEAAQTQWRVRSTWCGGTRSDHHVEGNRIGRETVDRKFTIQIDEPEQLCGTNQFANPQEHLFAGLNACMMVGYAAAAAMMGINLTRLEVRTEGDIDLRGFLAIDRDVPAGYDEIRQTVHLAGDGTPEQFAQIHEAVKATSPNFFNVVSAIPLQSELVVE